MTERDIEGFGPEQEVLEEIVYLGRSMGLEVDEGDIKELVKAHSKELTTEELAELQTQQQLEFLQEIAEESEAEEVISSSEIKEVLARWEKVSDFVEKNHPATGRASVLFNDTCLTHFRNILKGRKKLSSLDRFLLKHPADESEENVIKKKILLKKKK